MAALQWVRHRLFGQRDNLMVAVYTIIVVAMTTFVVESRGLPAPRFYGTLLALAALLAVNMLWLQEDEAEQPIRPTLHRWYLPVASGLVLLANALGLQGRVSFLPYLLFPVVGQAVSLAGVRWAIGLALALQVGWIAVVWGDNLADALNNSLGIAMGMVFTIVIMQVAVRYAEQRERAETLLRELQAATVALEAAREREKELAVAQERVRLAREIHDGLGHHLTVLNVQLQAAGKLLERDTTRAAATIETCKEVAQAALLEVRQSVASMRRTPLDGQSLEEALGRLVSDFDRHSPLAARFEQQGAAQPLSAAAAMTLFRAAQEGLTNAQKHGHAARQATVALHFGPTAVRLDVLDDGASDGAAPPNGGFGLAGLRERAEQLGGTFRAGPQPNGGFQLELSLPLDPATRTA